MCIAANMVYNKFWPIPIWSWLITLRCQTWLAGRSTICFDDFPSELNLPFLSCFSLATFDYQRYILWIEEILYQLVDGLSHDNPIVHSVSWLPNGYQLVQDFFHPPYVYDVFTLDCTISIIYIVYMVYMVY